MKDITLAKYNEVMKRLRQSCIGSEPTDMEIALAFYKYGVQVGEAEADKASKTEEVNPGK